MLFRLPVFVYLAVDAFYGLDPPVRLVSLAQTVFLLLRDVLCT